MTYYKIRHATKIQDDIKRHWSAWCGGSDPLKLTYEKFNLYLSEALEEIEAGTCNFEVEISFCRLSAEQFIEKFRNNEIRPFAEVGRDPITWDTIYAFVLINPVHSDSLAGNLLEAETETEAILFAKAEGHNVNQGEKECRINFFDKLIWSENDIHVFASESEDLV